MASSLKAGVSHGRVIIDCELSLKKNLHLEKVVPAMIEKKIILKDFGEALLKKNDMGTFVDCLKQLPLEQFVEFLKVVRAIEEEEDKERSLMKLLSSSLKNMKPKPGSNVEKVISNFIKAADTIPKSTQQPSLRLGSLTSMDESVTTAFPQSTMAQFPPPPVSIVEPNVEASCSNTTIDDVNKIQPTTDGSSDSASRAVFSAVASKLPFPQGYMSGSRIRSFTREGGMLYSPEHGVTVIIPEAAVPSSVEKFFLGIYVYLNGPFSLPQDALPCSPVVWFHLKPKFTFESDVVVKMPHCAVLTAHQRQEIADDSTTPPAAEEFLSVVTVEERADESIPCFSLTKQLDADFSDGYHAVFAVRHFSPHKVVKLKCQKKQWSTPRNRLGSNESSGVRKRVQSNQNSTANCLPGKCPTKTTTKELQKSGSLQDDEEELYTVTQRDQKKETSTRSAKQIDPKFFIARCMPKDRSTDSWRVDFLISHFHSTGIYAIEQFGKQLHGKRTDMVKKKIYFADEDIEFLPESWTSATGSWNVATTETNVLSMDEVLMQLPHLSAQRSDQMEGLCQLPRVTYSVQALTFPPKEQLDCTVQVRGAVAAKGKVPYFKLQSNATVISPKRSTRIKIYTVPYLYSPTSDILSAVALSNRSLCLDTQNPEHIKFLIDVSLHLTTDYYPRRLASELKLKPQQLEEIQQNSPSDSSWQVYNILKMWLATSYSSSETTLGTLLNALVKIEVESVELSQIVPGDSRDISLVPSEVDNEQIPDPRSEGEDKYQFLLNLGVKLQCCWRKVGSLMGIPKHVLDVLALEHRQLSEQSYQMLQTWQKGRRGCDCTYGVVFKAIQRMHEHNPDIVNDAWVYCVHIQQLLEQEHHNYFSRSEAPSIIAL